MPWKNGGGETREILVSPAGASLDTMEWRVSLATVASDGPFSEFRGITRTLSVIRGAGITLQVGGRSRQLLASSEPCTFDGEAPTSASLIEGPIVDLNVMSRRGVARHDVRKMSLQGNLELAASADVTLVFCRAGAVVCNVGGASVGLREEDCALLENPFEGDARAVQLIAAPLAHLFVIELYRALTISGS